MKLSNLFLTTIAIAFSSIAVAQTVIVKDTSTWSPVPINVDTTTNTYTVVGTVPTTSSDYYYSYSGHRCFATKRDIVGVDAVIFKAGVSGGTEIYCYPE